MLSTGEGDAGRVRATEGADGKKRHWGQGLGYEGTGEEKVPWDMGCRELVSGHGGLGGPVSECQEVPRTGVDALANRVRVQSVNVLVGRAADQVTGAVAGNLCDPGVGAVGLGQFDWLRWRVGLGAMGMDSAEQRQW